MKKKIPALIGVIHLPALGGAPGARGLHPAGALQNAGARAVEEARLLAKAGFHAIILENFGDVPFYKDRVPAETIASMAVIAAAVREAVKIQIGINVLRNDARAALAIAATTGCDFIRVNVLAGLTATDQGLIEGQAAELIRERDRLGADVRILADAQVKHARSLSSNGLALEIEEIALRAGADGVIITGATTGRFAEAEDIAQARAASKKHRIPIWVGSGATAATMPLVRESGFGVIVGSALRKGGKAGAPLDLKAIRIFMESTQKTAPKKKTKARK